MKDQSEFLAIILAGGKGTRLKIDLPKVLFPINQKPLIDYLFDSLENIDDIDILTVVGYKKRKLIEHLHGRSDYVIQEEQMGTGHAAMQCEEKINKYKNVFIFVGDAPFIPIKAIKRMIEEHIHNRADCTFLYSTFPIHLPYGRLLFDEDSNLIELIEEHKTDNQTSKIKEYFTSQYLFKGEVLYRILQEIKPDGVTGEYNLTDSINLLIKEKSKLLPIFIDEYWKLIGVNSKDDLKIILPKSKNV